MPSGYDTTQPDPWNHSEVSRTPVIRFRHSGAVAAAALIAFLGALPVATYRWYLLPILLVPLVVGVWGWRTGTDASATGLTLRRPLGSRQVEWSRVAGLVPDQRGRVYSALHDDGLVRLPAVSAGDLPRLVAASGHQLEVPAADGQ
jgi:hypothetical protein